MAQSEVCHNLVSQIVLVKNQKINCCHMNSVNAVHTGMNGLKLIHYCLQEIDWNSQRSVKCNVALKWASERSLLGVRIQQVEGGLTSALTTLNQSMGTVVQMDKTC